MAPNKVYPILPLELEREIFEVAARTDRAGALNLAVVASRVQTWVEPIVYEVILFNSSTMVKLFLRTIGLRPPSFFAKNVKALCFTYDVNTTFAMPILTVCTGLVNLACWVDIEHQPSFEVLPSLNLPHLTRLSLTLDLLNHNPNFNYNHTLFANITHLDIPHIQTRNVHLVPRLTHLSIFFWQDTMDPGQLDDILSDCKSLELLVLHGETEFDVSVPHFPQLDGVDDPRVVIIFCKNDQMDWESGALGHPNFWATAEEKAKRQRVKATTASTAFSAE